MIDPYAQPNDNSVSQHISAIDHTRRQLDAQLIQQLMTRVSGNEAVMWGDDVIGFGTYHYTYKTGREGDWPILSFHPIISKISIYVMPGFDNYQALLKKLGKHKTSTNCLFLHKLTDIDMQILEQLMATVYKDMQSLYTVSYTHLTLPTIYSV